MGCFFLILVCRRTVRAISGPVYWPSRTWPWHFSGLYTPLSSTILATHWSSLLSLFMNKAYKKNRPKGLFLCRNLRKTHESEVHTDSTNFFVTMAGNSLRVSLVFVRLQFFHMFSRRRVQCFEEIPLSNFGDVGYVASKRFARFWSPSLLLFSWGRSYESFPNSSNVFYSNALPLLFLLEKHNCIVILAFARI